MLHVNVYSQCKMMVIGELIIIIMQWDDLPTSSPKLALNTFAFAQFQQPSWPRKIASLNMGGNIVTNKEISPWGQSASSSHTQPRKKILMRNFTKDNKRIGVEHAKQQQDNPEMLKMGKKVVEFKVHVHKKHKRTADSAGIKQRTHNSIVIHAQKQSNQQLHNINQLKHSVHQQKHSRNQQNSTNQQKHSRLAISTHNALSLSKHNTVSLRRVAPNDNIHTLNHSSTLWQQQANKISLDRPSLLFHKPRAMSRAMNQSTREWRRQMLSPPAFQLRLLGLGGPKKPSINKLTLQCITLQ